MQPELTYKPDPELTAVIKKVHEQTAHYWLKTKLGNGLLILAEFTFYILAIGLVLIAILMPNGAITIKEWVTNEVKFVAKVEVKDIICFFTILKVIVGVLGLLMIVPARLFRKLRKKNNVLEEVNRVCGEYLKKVV